MRKIMYQIALVAAIFMGGNGSVWAADLVDIAAKSGNFKVFVAALKTTGFSETLRNTGPYTVFAPSDDAFAKLPAGTWDTLAKNKIRLAKVLSYHVVPGKMLVTEVKPGKMKTTQGEMLSLTSDNGKVTVNGANVTESDISADNGVIHAIDAVVMPPN